MAKTTARTSSNDASSANDFVLVDVEDIDIRWNRVGPVRKPLEAGELLCAACQPVQFQLGNILTYSLSKDLPLPRNLGTFTCIVSTVDCAFCRLVTKTLQQENVTSTSSDDFGCIVAWVRDGQRFHEVDNLRMQEWTTLKLRLTPDDNRAFLPIDFVPVCTDADPDTLFLGRVVDAKHININLLRKWMNLCETWHGDSCSPTISQTVLESLHHIRLIDIQDRCLVDALPTKRFVALSYVWGSVEVFKTKKSNVSILKCAGGLDIFAAEFPRSIRDAMDLVKLLGEKYLWIDSICIIQDDDQDKLEQVSQMDMIYGCATFTIVVAGGVDADAGLPGVSDHARNLEQIKGQCGSDLTLLRLQPTCEQALEQSQWNTRAWTYQERLLSKRSLIFINDTVYYQCNRAVWAEDYISEDPTVHSCATIEGYEFTQTPEATDVYKTQQYTIHTYETPFFPEYGRIIAKYTLRKLTFRADRLIAVSGVLQNFVQVFGIVFHFGLPESLFDAALLWQPVQQSRRIVLDDIPNEHQLPSWSWAGWMGGVEYDPATSSNGQKPRLEHFARTRPLVNWQEYNKTDGACRHINKNGGMGFTGTNSALPPGWRCMPNNEKDPLRLRVYVQDNQPHIFHSAPPFPPSTGDIILNPRDRVPSRYLRLRAETAQFKVSDLDKGGVLHQGDPRPGIQRPLAWRFGIADKDGEWVGTTMLPGAYRSRLNVLYTFVAISEAYCFTEEELNVTQARQLEPFAAYNCLMITSLGDGVVERLGLAKILKAAWRAARPLLEELVLG